MPRRNITQLWHLSHNPTAFIPRAILHHLVNNLHAIFYKNNLCLLYFFLKNSLKKLEGPLALA